MTKLLIAKIKCSDGSEYSVKTYADERDKPVWVLMDLLSKGDRIVRFEWIDTLTELRRQWNAEHPECRISLD